ncbi:delta-60 repeat domain-containing protein [Pandoraea oxalativorans]|uniref:Delta-60 repeat domain-containing protein n=1 Tax=Pandoraea oxalativorans TaxID=573737 RepID=A0A0E3YBI1_9BURK|nr:delta-60 repeat domain-containing protein [Pandoraea oxalativorans]AKC70335.1 hypothetical protein MB84_13840 [Pandoraea oxalativorans]
MSKSLRSGEFDPTFGQGGHVDMSVQMPAAMLLPDQKIVLAGTLPSAVGLMVYRLMPNGRPDPSFGETGVEVRFPHDFFGSFRPFKLMRQSSGKFVVAGTLDITDTVSRGLVARLHPDGRLDETFGNGGVTLVEVPEGPGNRIRGAMMLPDDKIVMVVHCVMGLDNFIGVFVRLAPDGTFDYTFGEGGFARTIARGVNVLHASLLPDGKILLAGGGASPAPTKMLVARFLSNGQADVSFGADGYAYLEYSETFPDTSAWQVQGVVPQADGKSMLMGNCRDPGFKSLSWYSRLLPDGSIDTSFNGGELLFSQAGDVQWSGLALAVTPDGKGVATGATLGVSKALFERIGPNGEPDPSFGDGGIVLAELPTPNALWTPYQLLVQSDSELLIVAFTLLHSSPTRLSRMLL